MTNTQNALKPNDIADDDLKEHGVQDIIPEDEEYYTLDLKRNFDGDEDSDTDIAEFDVTNGDPHNIDYINQPHGTSSFYNDATVVHADSDDQSKSDNLFIPTNDVGNPVHWGVDEDSE